MLAEKLEYRKKIALKMTGKYQGAQQREDIHSEMHLILPDKENSKMSVNIWQPLFPLFSLSASVYFNCILSQKRLFTTLKNVSLLFGVKSRFLQVDDISCLRLSHKLLFIRLECKVSFS